MIDYQKPFELDEQERRKWEEFGKRYNQDVANFYSNINAQYRDKGGVGKMELPQLTSLFNGAYRNGTLKNYIGEDRAAYYVDEPLLMNQKSYWSKVAKSLRDQLRAQSQRDSVIRELRSKFGLN